MDEFFVRTVREDEALALQQQRHASNLKTVVATNASGGPLTIPVELTIARDNYDVRSKQIVLRNHAGVTLLSQLLRPEVRRVKSHVLVDRSLVDVFGNDGLTWNCAYFRAGAGTQTSSCMPKAAKRSCSGSTSGR
jgi:hypothetical protein